MWTNGVVGAKPLFGECTYLRERAKAVQVELLFTKSAVEALNVGVLSRLARLNEIQFDVVRSAM
jgi:hypothetical protein